MKYLSTILAFVFLTSGVLFAQIEYKDQLVKRDGKVIKCKIKEIGDDEIKYLEEGISSDVVSGIDVSKVEKIIFANGTERKMDNAMSTYEDLSKQRKNDIKFNLFMPITGGYAFTYERSLKPARSLEFELGIISKSDNNEMEIPGAHGVFFKTGYKMMRSPDYYIRGMKYAHILKGGYVKPELAFTTFNYNRGNSYYDGSSESQTGTETKFAILINLGKQVIYTNSFALDFYVGAGYALGEVDPELNYYAFTSVSENTSFILTGGLRIGFLF